MNWDGFFLVCFAVGLVLSVVSALGGFTHLHLGHQVHIGAHSHVAGVAHGSGHAAAHAAGEPSVSPFNGFTLIAFLCWFGGAGYLLHHYGGFMMPLVLGLSTLSGLAGAAVVFWFLAKVLLPHERELSAEETSMPGTVARVSGVIRAEGTGEIQFTQNGARGFAAARSDSGEEVGKGEEVVVMRYERGIAYVRRWDELTDATFELRGHTPAQGDTHVV